MSSGKQSATGGRYIRSAIILALSAALTPQYADAQGRGAPWVRHVIDNSSSGADGARGEDVNGDGLIDIATGWEEGGAVRAYLHPGTAAATEPWPSVTVGSVADVEDAVFVDLDGDGAMDVVSCAEGTTRKVTVHWAPSNPASYLDPAQWQSAMIPASAGLAWMFAVPMQVDGVNGVDLVAGAKWGGKIGWFKSPASNPRNLSQWQFYEMSGVGWTMSLIDYDMDNDGDLDIVVTDRYNDVGLQGARWLENPGTGSPAQMNLWTNRFIGARGKEAMLTVMKDLDEDGLDDIVVPIRDPGAFSYFRRTHPTLNSWQEYPIACPPNVGTPKAVNIGDIDLDGDLDIVASFAAANGNLSGVIWMSYVNAPTDYVWQDHEISGPEGIKYDIVALVDLDGDGDLDVITTEEQTNTVGLGLIWYENPTAVPIPGDFDRDGDVDQIDFGHIQGCLSGPGVMPADPACERANMNADGGVDQADVALFRSCMTGPNIPADPDCLN